MLPQVLESSRRVLIVGAGGGFDVYAGLPIYHRLRISGKAVFLANLSFANLPGTTARELVPSLFEVTAETRGEDHYFPERTLSRFLSRKYEAAIPVYAFERVGARPIREGYQHLIELLQVDTVVLVDGGTDILLRGDELSLGTPAEDMVSLAAVHDLPLETKIIVCVGMGIDRFHGVCHANWLENVAELTWENGFLGAIALLKKMPEVEFYLDAVADAERVTIDRPSIVNSSIASAIEGRFGDYHRTRRTRQSKLFISPLMSLMWAFELEAVAKRNLYLSELRETISHQDVLLAIERFHATVPTRPVTEIPY